MPIVGGLDIHRKQITFGYMDTVTGEVKRGQIARAGRQHLRAWLARFAGRGDGHRDVQSALRPVVPAGASPGSAVLPGTTWLPPAARVTFTRRAWALGDAGMVTCRTPSA